MKISHFGGVSFCNTFEEVFDVLKIRFNESVNEFWITDDEKENPCLAVLVNNDMANVTFFPSDGHPGFQSAGNDKDAEGYTVFYTNTPEEEIEISNDMIITFEQAVQAVEEFFVTKSKPLCIEWVDLSELI